MHSAGQITGDRTLAKGAIAAAWEWWREAGVDCDFADAPATWLAGVPADVAAPAALPAAAARPVAEIGAPRLRIGGAAEAWPKTFEEFASWWLSEPSLDEGQSEGRVAPRGKPGARLMVMVDHPEAEDNDRLLSGAQGKLLDAVLRAMGLGEADTYVASMLPRAMPLPDWPALAAGGLGKIAAHHVALARPERLLVFGSNASSLLGHDPANSDGFLPGIHHEGASIPVFVAPGLVALAARPRVKARFWQALLDWTAADWTGTKTE